MSYFKRSEFEKYLKGLGQNPKSYSTAVSAVFNRKLLGLNNLYSNGNLICTKNDLVDILNTLIKFMMYASTTNNTNVIQCFKVNDPQTLYNYAYALTEYKDFIEKMW